MKLLPAVASVALLLSSVSAGAVAPVEAPIDTDGMNVLMIMVDDLNTLGGSYGGPAITPNMDAFARTAVRFEEAYPASPSCNPSRVAMLTGRRPEVSGLLSNAQHFRELDTSKDLVTLPQLLKDRGYHTLASGKIFHNRRGGKAEPEPLSDPVSWSYQANIKNGKFFGNDFKTEFLDENGVPKWVSRATGLPSDRAAKRKVKSTWSFGPMADVDPHNTLDFYSGKFAAAYLNDDQSDPLVAAAPARDDKPFFLACGVFRPHIPLIVPQQYFDLYETAENAHRLAVPDFPADDRDDLPGGAPGTTDFYVDYIKPNPREQQNLRHAYLAATTYADEAVGLALDGLKKSGLADRTIVIVMGDHGFDLGEKDHLGKTWVWRNPARTPLMIRVPGLAPGVCDEPVSLLDLYPTLMQLLGVADHPELDGVSLVALLRDPGADRDVPAVVTSAGKGRSIGIVQDHWNYISHVAGGEELYDHRTDPLEHHNLLAGTAPAPAAVATALDLARFIPTNRAGDDGTGDDEDGEGPGARKGGKGRGDRDG